MREEGHSAGPGLGPTVGEQEEEGLQEALSPAPALGRGRVPPSSAYAYGTPLRSPLPHPYHHHSAHGPTDAQAQAQQPAPVPMPDITMAMLLPGDSGEGEGGAEVGDKDSLAGSPSPPSQDQGHGHGHGHGPGESSLRLTPTGPRGQPVQHTEEEERHGLDLLAGIDSLGVGPGGPASGSASAIASAGGYSAAPVGMGWRPYSSPTASPAERTAVPTPTSVLQRRAGNSQLLPVKPGSDAFGLRATGLFAHATSVE